MLKSVFLPALFSIFLVSACSQKSDLKTSASKAPEQTQTVAATSGKGVESPAETSAVIQNSVITADLCTAARTKNANAQYKIAEYYAGQVDDLGLDSVDTGVRHSFVAAMYWYDLAAHYGYDEARDKRRVLGLSATPEDFKLYRTFSKDKDNPPCLPEEVAAVSAS